MGVFQDISAAHERLKKRIHAFRMPLSPTVYRIAMFCYFTIPIVGGYFLMQYTNRQRDANLGRDGSRLAESQQVSREVLAQNAELQRFLTEKRRSM